MEAIGAISGLITVVEVSVRISRLCLAYSREVKNASEDIQRLEQTILHLKSTTESVLDLLQGPDNWRLRASQKLRQAAEDSKTRLDNLEERLQPSSTRGKFMRLGLSSLKWPFQKKDMDRLITELSQCSQAISAALQVDQLNLSLQASEHVANIGRGIRDLDRRALLDQLPVVHGAAYDSHAEEQNSVCLAETRVDYLHQILEWANAPEAETLLWLKGMAGTGKSTISRTIARSLAARGLLGANFFFKRGESDRSSVSKLFTTLAFQLSVGNRRIAQQVMAAIKSDPALPNKATKDQFDKLVLEPIVLAYQGHENSTLVVILDALDECEDHTAARNVINLFSQSRSLLSLNLRVFITSRPEVMIRLGFNEVAGSYRSLDLSDAPMITVEQDIARYFTSELARIRHEYNVRVAEDRRLNEDWPGQNRARDLIEMAIPLFIFAATVCRFLAEVRWEPDEQLVKILNYRALSQLSKLDATYTPVLDQLTDGLSEPEVEEVISDFQEVVGTIIILESPLSTKALSKLLDIPKRKIDRCLDMLHSVLSIPESPESPVRLLHNSFRDYLLDPKLKGSNQFWVDKKVVHQNLVSCCLRLMTETLHEDMCHLEVPGALRAAIDRRVISEGLPQDLQYAVQYWAYHASENRGDGPLLSQILTFLEAHFLHWVEALSLLGQLASVFKTIKGLQILANIGPSSAEGLVEFLLDGALFVRRFFEAIDVAPLQLYSSALLFSPTNSLVRQRNKIPPWVLVPPQMPSDWDPCVLIMEGHKRDVHMSIMSPDSKLIAACTSGKGIWIWDGENGSLITKLQGHSKKVMHIAFSADSRQIASYSDDQTIRLWDIKSATCLREHNFPFCRQHAVTDPVVILQDSDLVARTRHEDQSFHVWRVEDGQLVEKFDTQGEEVSLLNTHNKITTVLSAGTDGKLRLWRTGASNSSHQFDTKETATMATMSSDSKMVALSFHSLIQVWRTDSFECIGEYSAHEDGVAKMAFSPNSELLVSGSVDSMICIWRLEDGVCMRTIVSHSHHITSLAFSSDSTMVISSSYDNTVRVWRAFRDEKEAQSLGTSHSITPIGITGDLEFAVSMSRREPDSKLSLIHLWSPDSGQFIDDIVVAGGRIIHLAISRDSKSIITAHESGVIRIWSINSRQCIADFPVRVGIKYFAVDYDSEIIACSFAHSIEFYGIRTGGHVKTVAIDKSIYFHRFSFKSPSELVLYDTRTCCMMNIETGTYENLGLNEEFEPLDFVVDKTRRWILWNQQRLLYLPIQYYWASAELCSRTAGQEAAIMFSSQDELVVIKFSVPVLERLYLEKHS